MLHELFYWVLNMSIMASVIGLLLYCIRFIKGFPKFGIYVLWGVVLIRLTCPLGISSVYSLTSIISRFAEKTYVKAVLIDGAAAGSQILPKLTLSNTIQAATAYNPIIYKTNILEGFFKVASVAWIIISISAMIAVVIMYILTRSELKKATHLHDNIYEGTMVNTPTVYAIVNPKIVLPVGVENEHLEDILIHERIHIKRRDNIWRMIAIIVACIHWFNPLIWVFLKSFFGDSELACDERAIKKMNIEERKRYALTLLTYGSMDKTVFASAFGSSKVKIRIKNILSYKKLTLFSTVCFAGMLMVIAFILLTNAVI